MHVGLFSKPTIGHLMYKIVITIKLATAYRYRQIQFMDHI